VTSAAFEDSRKSASEVRLARDEAEVLRDELLAEYRRICADGTTAASGQPQDERRKAGAESMRKAIAAANRAIDSINQALRELERVTDD